MIGGIRPFQTITVICGVPALAIIALMALSFFKDIRKNGWRLSGENSEDKISEDLPETAEAADLTTEKNL